MARYNFGDFDAVKYLDEKGLSPEAIAVSAGIAMTKVGQWAEGQILQDLSAKLKLSQEVIKKRVFSNRSKKYLSGAYVVGYRKPMNLARFDAVQTATGIQTSVKNVPGAFLAKMPGGRMKIAMRRVGRGRLPIEPVTYDVRPHFDDAFSKLLSSGAVKDKAIEELNKQLPVELRKGV